MSKKNKLKELLLSLAVKKGEFILASGKKSNYYIDMREVTLHPEGAYLIGKVLYERIKDLRESGEDIKSVGGITLGGDPIVTAVAVVSYLEGDNIFPFIIRKEPKSHGTGQWIEGRGKLKEGMKCLILEDVVTTGKTSIKGIRIAKEHGLDVRGVIALVDREEGGKEAIEKEGVFFEALYSLSELGIDKER